MDERMILNLGAATNVIAAIRTHTAQTTGCPEWDAPGIKAMLTGTEGTPGSVLAAAALAAEDPRCLKPSTAATRTHWPVNATSNTPRVPNLDLCPDHGNPRRDCLDCRRDAGPEASDDFKADIAASIRAGLAEVRSAARERDGQRRAARGGAS